MPFVPQENRKKMAEGEPPQTVGDECYLHYRQLIKQWKKEPRWTTWHNQVKDVLNIDDDGAARLSALLVHFVLQIMPYEIKKRKENGDVK